MWVGAADGRLSLRIGLLGLFSTHFEGDFSIRRERRKERKAKKDSPALWSHALQAAWVGQQTRRRPLGSAVLANAQIAPQLFPGPILFRRATSLGSVWLQQQKNQKLHHIVAIWWRLRAPTACALIGNCAWGGGFRPSAAPAAEAGLLTPRLAARQRINFGGFSPAFCCYGGC